MIKKTFSSEVDDLMNTIIGKDTLITGTIDVKGELKVDGTVKGKIICSDCVTVGATGLVEADIESNTAVIAGHMVGNVATTEKVELQAKCELEGDIKTKSLVIEQGAMFCGSCNMKGGSARSDLGFLPPENRRTEKTEEKKEPLFSSEKSSFNK